MGISLKRIIETILALCAMIFQIIEGVRATSDVLQLTIMVVAYLLLIILLSLIKRGDLNSAGMAAIESTFGVVLLMFNIQSISSGYNPETLLLCAYIMNIVVGAMFLVFNLFG